MEPNMALLRKTMEYIEEHPEEWSQYNWWVARPGGCGTTMCYAGTAVMLAGYEPVLDDNFGYVEVTGYCTSAEGGGRHRIAQVATEELGLTFHQADRIFSYMTEDPAQLRAVVEDVVGCKL